MAVDAPVCRYETIGGKGEELRGQRGAGFAISVEYTHDCVRVTITAVDWVINIAAEIESAVKIGGAAARGTVLDPQPFDEDPGLQGMGADYPGEVVGEVENLAPIDQGPMRSELDGRGIENVAKGDVGQQVVRVGLRVELGNVEADGVALDFFDFTWEEVVVAAVVVLADGELIDQAGRENVLVPPGMEKAAAFDLRRVHGPGNAGPGGVALLQAAMFGPGEGEDVLIAGVVIGLEAVHVVRHVRRNLRNIVVASLGNDGIQEVRQGKELKQFLSIWVEAVGGDTVVGERDARGGVHDSDQCATLVAGLGEIAGSFECGGHGDRAQRSAHLLGPEFLRPEEEQLFLVAVELARNVERTADVIVPGVEAVGRFGGVGAVIEETIGVELFVPFVVRTHAVEILGSGLHDHLDIGAGEAAVLGLVTAEEYFYFRDGIHTDYDIELGIVARMVECETVERDIVGIGSVALDVEIKELRDSFAGVVVAACGARIAFGGIDHAWQQAQKGSDLAVADHQIIHLRVGDQQIG